MQFGVRLLLLVALLLPFRGAMAVAGVLCHADVPTPAVGMSGPGHDHHADHAHGPANDAAVEVAHDHDAQEPAAPAGTSCTFCSAICAAPPLPAAGLGVHAVQPPGAERFPSVSPPRTTAAFGALERPPRTV